MDNPERERKPVRKYHDHGQEEHEFHHACDIATAWWTLWQQAIRRTSKISAKLSTSI